MDTFCSLPWRHLATHPDGGVTLCCVSDHTNGMSRAKNYNPKTFLNLNENSIEEIVNSDYFKEVRLQMLNNEIPESCKRCFDEEKAGVRSKRMEENEKFSFTKNHAHEITADDGTIPVNFNFVELRLGNLCNLKCRTCNPNSSTKWMIPYQRMQSELKFVTQYDKKISTTWTEDEKFWEDLYRHSDDLELIYVNGGEPTLVEKHWKYLENLIDKKLNEKIVLWYNINMTNIPDKLLSLWKKFKKVQITCSIDDLYERNDYIREGSDWNTIIDNLEKLQNEKWLHLSVCQTISWMNVYYINDFIKFMKNRNLHVHMNYVYDPHFLSLQCLPYELKDHVLARCIDLDQWQYNSLESQFRVSDDTAIFKRGLEYTKWLDKCNNKNFKDTFPEWNSVLEQYLD
jgi:MoaA/NifB/PqqE/SkfB family radical SAM enzyme